MSLRPRKAQCDQMKMVMMMIMMIIMMRLPLADDAAYHPLHAAQTDSAMRSVVARCACVSTAEENMLRTAEYMEGWVAALRCALRSRPNFRSVG